MPRYYTAKDMADHYSSKLDVKLTEEDIHRIMKNASPGIDKYNGLYPEEESNKFEKYFFPYFSDKTRRRIKKISVLGFIINILLTIMLCLGALF